MNDDKKQVPIAVRIVGGVLASGLTSFVLTKCSLSGTDFQALGLSSETIKSSIDGAVTGVFVAPECIPLAIAGGIMSIRMAWRMIREAFTKDLPPEGKE